MINQTLITTRVGKYVWDSVFQVIEWIPAGRRKATISIGLNINENTELRAMIRATNHMLSMLKEERKQRLGIYRDEST